MKSALDILKRTDEANFLWLEAAEDLQSAKSLIEERQALSPGEYVVFDRRTQQIVAHSKLTASQSRPERQRNSKTTSVWIL